MHGHDRLAGSYLFANITLSRGRKVAIFLPLMAWGTALAARIFGENSKDGFVHPELKDQPIAQISFFVQKKYRFCRVRGRIFGVSGKD